MMSDHPYLPDLEFASGNAVTPELSKQFLDAGARVSGPARSLAPLLGVARSIQSAGGRVTAAYRRMVLRVVKDTDVCRIAGHPIRVQPWEEMPGHHQNWMRVIRCHCGVVHHFQFCNNWRNPDEDWKA